MTRDTRPWICGNENCLAQQGSWAANNCVRKNCGPFLEPPFGYLDAGKPVRGPAKGQTMTHKDLSPHAKADPRQARYEVARRAFQALHGRVIKRMDTNR